MVENLSDLTDLSDFMNVKLICIDKNTGVSDEYSPLNCLKDSMTNGWCFIYAINLCN